MESMVENCDCTCPISDQILHIFYFYYKYYWCVTKCIKNVVNFCLYRKITSESL